MHIWSLQGFAGIDFATRTTTLVRPSDALRRREFDVRRLSAGQVEYYRQHLAEEHLPREQLQFDAVDALALEIEDFVESIRTLRPPRVSGEAGRDALAVAEQILARIHTHAWDDAPDGPVGPHCRPRRSVIPAPQLAVIPPPVPMPRKEAG